jgi:hypothetical protein
MDETLQDIYRNIDAQIRNEQAKAKLKSPQGDRRLGPGTPPAGMQERRTGEDRRHNARSPRAKDNEE